MAMTLKVSVVVLKHLQEVDIMNSHLLDRVSNEKAKEVMRSIELFLVIAFLVSVVGFVCLAVA
jgi:hypothetical protein